MNFKYSPENQQKDIPYEKYVELEEKYQELLGDMGEMIVDCVEHTDELHELREKIEAEEVPAMAAWLSAWLDGVRGWGKDNVRTVDAYYAGHSISN